jgi:hypothetical protein
MSADVAAWTTLVPVPGENRGFTERGRYAFESPGEEWAFVVDDARLHTDSNNGKCWSWEPGFFAGEVTAALLHPDGRVITLYLLDVAPDPAKVGRDVFRQMIDELWEEDPELVVGSEPATTRMGALGETQNPWVEFARLRRYAPEFLKGLAALQANARWTLHIQRTSAPFYHARRVDRRTALAVARGSAAALFVREPESMAFPSPDTRLDVPVIERTLDAAANRAMLALLRAVLRRTRSLRERLQQIVDQESESGTRTSMRERWPTRRDLLMRFATELEVMLRRSPFCRARRAEVTAAGLTAVAADPLYARAWGRGWRALRHGLEAEDKSERLWVSPSWEIYERWCYVRLGKLLMTAAPAWGWRRAKRPERWLGSQAGRRATLSLQPTFSSHETESPGMWSISRERVPDLVLTVESSDGVQFVVLDAKYRTSRANVLKAMASAHIYEDSLRIGAGRPEMSLLLVPAGGGAPWLEKAEFHETHHVGVHPFPPDASATVPRPIRRLLSPNENCQVDRSET